MARPVKTFNSEEKIDAEIAKLNEQKKAIDAKLQNLQAVRSKVAQLQALQNEISTMVNGSVAQAETPETPAQTPAVKGKNKKAQVAAAA